MSSMNKRNRNLRELLSSRELYEKERYDREYVKRRRETALYKNSMKEVDEELRAAFPEYAEKLKVLPEDLQKIMEFRPCANADGMAEGPCLVMLVPYRGKSWKFMRREIWNTIITDPDLYIDERKFRRFWPRCVPRFNPHFERLKERRRETHPYSRPVQNLRKPEGKQISVSGRRCEETNTVSGCCAPWHLDTFYSLAEYQAYYRDIQKEIRNFRRSEG